MTVEFTKAMYDSPRLRQYYGVTMYTDPGPAREHIKKLQGAPYYMSVTRIAELAGVSRSGLTPIMRGYRCAARDNAPIKRGIHRDTEAAILGVQPEIAASPPRGGARINPEGTRRRLQALVALGYPLAFLCGPMGWGGDPQPVYRIVCGASSKNFVMYSTFLKAVAAYEKYSDVDPATLGFSSLAINRAKGSAKRRRYAPPHCWDVDTIDDPDAWPEWTGSCGTPHGRTVHQREGIPMCQPCRDATQAHRAGKLGPPPGEPAEHSVLDREKLIRLMDQKGLSAEALGNEIGVSENTVITWRGGQRNPRTDGLEKLASYFHLHVSELTL